MKPNLIYELVELAISLAQTHIDAREDTDRILLDIIQKSVLAFEDQTGETLETRLVGTEARSGIMR